MVQNQAIDTTAITFEKIAPWVAASSIFLSLAILAYIGTHADGTVLVDGKPRGYLLPFVLWALAVDTAVVAAGRILRPKGGTFIAYAIVGTIALMVLEVLLAVFGLSQVSLLAGFAAGGALCAAAYVGITTDGGTIGIIDRIRE